MHAARTGPGKGIDASVWDGRVALVTGGSKGIGLGIAKALARRKISLVLVARNETDLALAKTALHKEHPKLKVDTLSADLSKKESFALVTQFLHKTHGKLDILVNNAGDFKQLPSHHEGKARDRPEEIAQDVESLFTVNAIPPAVFAHVLMPLLLASDHPQQLDVLSSAALEIFSGNNPYGPTKAAHERVSLSTVADSNARICTYRVYPSNTDTRIVKQFHVPKLTPDDVGEEAVRMMLYDEGTDLYLKMGHDGMVKALFTLDYSRYVRETETGDILVDGLGLVSDHRMLVRAHFEPVIRAAKH